MEESLLASETEDIRDLKGRVWVESKRIWKLAFPAMLSRVGQYGMFVVTQVFMGHIGELELAAYALIQTITVRFAYGILVGMSSANSTMCGQAFGAKQYHMLGIYLQRSWIINLTTATILLPVFIFSASIFKLLGQEEDIASKAGHISLWFIPIIYSYALMFNMQQFLQSQHKNVIIGWLSAASFALHVLLSWIFVSKLNLGIPGAMAAMIVASWLVTIALFLYIFCGWCPNTWKGFTLAALADLFPAVKLSLSSGVMICLELWYNAVLVLLAGYLKNATTEISAFSICINIIAWELTLCLGLVVACSVRVSNELGRGDAKAAIFSIKVNLTTTVLMGVLFSIICLVFGNRIGYIFTSDEQVADTVSSLSVLLAISVFLNSSQTIFTGAAIGSGRQGMVAYINICSYYLIGVPVGALLGYIADLKVEGIWIGMILGVVIQTLVLGYITWKTDWNEQVDKASKRLNRFKRPLEESDGN
ncbi:protein DETOXIFICATION 24-like [Mangifera indica]|uniref:protein DETOXIFICATION 24-like n=1 Tax=Mangifera indica TaxID=29780 RepID=UPI001CF9A8CA|nr:protein DETOXIFICATION 24-like [Mangifera indica]